MCERTQSFPFSVSARERGYQRISEAENGTPLSSRVQGGY